MYNCIPLWDMRWYWYDTGLRSHHMTWDPIRYAHSMNFLHRILLCQAVPELSGYQTSERQNFVVKMSRGWNSPVTTWQVTASIYRDVRETWSALNLLKTIQESHDLATHGLKYVEIDAVICRAFPYAVCPLDPFISITILYSFLLLFPFQATKSQQQSTSQGPGQAGTQGQQGRSWAKAVTGREVPRDR